MMVVTERGGNEKERETKPQERKETDGWRSRTTETVFRKEDQADEKPTGDSPGAGTVCVCLCRSFGDIPTPTNKFDTEI